ncbi:hypothetical protein [Pseudomonas syringae]|uniref:hypothetical protein n=1 Tax=Pseudomonas syringae TaxID=317 RepID=UPI001F435749|nr:hypothetical protein [Pseudomonas syringae]MCF5371327.1 hypothetical protein [Pseudomonas syringae]MCF5382076.1 hypothetical protein [Pseudomonas syringae]MCF5419340.1 hypothetical protein [Pseudomonas syringae]MCF5454470.1 hypothetical protein [Pseudomonas syringae]MCF5458404.1 hypothetical protein [Pseudomonas syringae]
MSKGTTLDPFEPLAFFGYIDTSTGRQEKYLSLAHFIHSERVAGVDEDYRRYLLQLDDTELFRLEVDGVGLNSADKPDWHENKIRLLYAGIYMQALANRERYGQLLSGEANLAIAHCSFSADAAEAMGHFVADLHNPQDNLKVAFLGATRDVSFIGNCLAVIFARKGPQCLLALEDDGCSSGVSAFARKEAASFALIASSLSEDAITENILRRSTHIFHFASANDSELTSAVVSRLKEAGAKLTPIQPAA